MAVLGGRIDPGKCLLIQTQFGRVLIVRKFGTIDESMPQFCWVVNVHKPFILIAALAWLLVNQCAHVNGQLSGTDVSLANWNASPQQTKTGVVAAGFEEESADVKPAEPATVTAEAIQAEMKLIEEQSSLTEDVKKDALERLKKALDWLKSSDENNARRKEHEQAIIAMPARREQLQAELAKPTTADPVALPENATIAQLEAKLTEMRHAAEALEAESTQKETELLNRSSRLAEIGKEVQDTEKRIADAKQQIAALTGTEPSTRFKQIEQSSRLRARQAELQMLKAEQQRMEAYAEVEPMERDLTRRQLNASRKQLEAWQSTVDAWRKEESARQAKEARRIAQNSHPAFQTLASENARIAETRTNTAAKIEEFSGMLKEIRSASQKYRDEFEELQRKVDIAGTTSSTGILLRTHRDQLPDQNGFRTRAAFVREELPATSLQLIEFRAKRSEIVDPSEVASGLIDSISQLPDRFDRSEVHSALVRLLSDRRDLLDRVIADQTTYLRDLNELELANQAFQEQIAEMRAYLDQRVLWVKSAEPMSFSDIGQAWQEARFILSPRRWSEVIRVAFGDAFLKPATAVAILSFFALLMMGRAHLLRAQDAFCKDEEASQPRFSRYLAAFIIALILSARWPVLIGAIGYRLTVAGVASDWTKAVGNACILTALLLWACEVVREICRKGGIGEELFEWPSTATSTVRGTLEVTLLIAAPLLALLQLSGHNELSKMQNLQRLLFIGSLALLSLQVFVLTRPGGSLMQALGTESHSGSTLYRLRRLICMTLTLLPLAFCLLSLSGYHFSAVQLSARLTQTGGAIIGVILLYNLAACWLDANARIGFSSLTSGNSNKEDAEKINEDSLDESEDEEDVAEVGIPAIHRAHREAHDLVRYAALLTLLVAAWIIWKEVLPAIRVLDRFELWTSIESVAETVVNQDGIQSIRHNEKTVVTTLTDLLKAATVCLAFVVIGRRLPSVLDLVVLNRLAMDQGGRQAITILLRYGITLAGLVIACGIVNISWSSVQWLAAAFTVGLGFGLQEIFANLVSGLIILFERPIRAGDLVTVGELTGNVTRMQMRATTITDFDRREMIVPNKKFITDNVINWTLSDPISRIVLPVGVAYGTDVRRVQRLLLRIAKRSPLVLTEPAPTTLFKGFGASTLDVELRVFIPKRDVYVEVVNELNTAIAHEFRAAGIEIAFPQHDLHIKSLDGLAASVTEFLKASQAERKTA